MKHLKFAVILMFTVFFSACSYDYEILIINDSDKQIEIRYKISEEGQFDEILTKSADAWKSRKSIRSLWEKEEPWQVLQDSEFETDLKTRERKIKIPPKQIVKIERGNYNPVTEEYGDLTDIVELQIVSLDGEIQYKGKLLLKQFEKEGYTFIKTYKGELKGRN